MFIRWKVFILSWFVGSEIVVMNWLRVVLWLYSDNNNMCFFVFCRQVLVKMFGNFLSWYMVILEVGKVVWLLVVWLFVDWFKGDVGLGGFCQWFGFGGLLGFLGVVFMGGCEQCFGVIQCCLVQCIQCFGCCVCFCYVVVI